MSKRAIPDYFEAAPDTGAWLRALVLAAEKAIRYGAKTLARYLEDHSSQSFLDRFYAEGAHAVATTRWKSDNLTKMRMSYEFMLERLDERWQLYQNALLFVRHPETGRQHVGPYLDAMHSVDLEDDRRIADFFAAIRPLLEQAADGQTAESQASPTSQAARIQLAGHPLFAASLRLLDARPPIPAADLERGLSAQYQMFRNRYRRCCRMIALGLHLIRVGQEPENVREALVKLGGPESLPPDLRGPVLPYLREEYQALAGPTTGNATDLSNRELRRRIQIIEANQSWIYSAKRPEESADDAALL